MRRSLVIAGILVLIAVLAVVGLLVFVQPSTDAVAPSEADDPDLYIPTGSDSGFWPYLNAEPEFRERSPINLIVRGDRDAIIQAMTEESDGDWAEIVEGHGDAGRDTYSVDAVNESGIKRLATETAWADATGTARYAFVDPGDGGEWVRETKQLQDGDYYGSRYHIRLYESPNPDDEWVAIQTHTEHFDWFTLKHRVDGLEAAQSHLETDFMDHPDIDETEDVSRIPLGNSGPSDSDGWATVVDLAMVLPALALVGMVSGVGVYHRRLTEVDRRRLRAARERLTPEHFLLSSVIVGLILGVRMMGVLLERHVDWLSMHAIAALLYPVIAIGLPVVIYAIANRLEHRIDAAVTAGFAVALGIWLDYAYVDVAFLHVDVIIQRIGVVLSLGLIAAGAARRASRESRWNDLLVTGVFIWVVLLIGTLMGWI